jgi:hypothetical protein
MEKGTVNKHRYTYSGGIKAVEEEKWGRDTARSRYGALKFEDGAPMAKDQSFPQFRDEQPTRRNPGEIPPSSWLRGGNESGKPKR